MSETPADAGIARPREDLAAFRDRPVLEQVLLGLISIIGVGLTLGTIYYAYVRPISRSQFAVVFFGVGVALYYLLEALNKVENPIEDELRPSLSRRLSDRSVGALRRFDAVVCLVSAAAAAVTAFYVSENFFYLSDQAIVFGFSDIAVYVGLVIVFLTIDATRRAYGWSIALVTVAAVLYALWPSLPVVGGLMPGPLEHPGFSLTDVATFGAVRITGAFSFIMEVGATWVAIFIMFAGLARAYGALDFILGIGQKLGENLKSGVVHIAVLSSMAMGSITGSAAANTATTGSFTIPMMKRQGVDGQYAAAIESVASAGGQIMPPVMGVAAFLMADILGVSYVRVIQAALVPAILFYFSTLVAVQFAVVRYGWTTERTADQGIRSRVLDPGTLVSVGYTLLGLFAFVVARGLVETVAVGGVELFDLPTLGLSPLGAAAVTGAVLLGVRLLQAGVESPSVATAREDFLQSIRRFMDGGHFAIPMLVLLYTLVVMQLSPMSAGLYTIVTLIATMLLRNLVVYVLTDGEGVDGGDGGGGTVGERSEEREASADERDRETAPGLGEGLLERTGSTIWRTVYTTLRGFRVGAADMAPLVGVLAAMGVIIAMVTQTGLTGTISTTMVALGGGVLIVVLLLAMITSILFGLGMPTPAAYILVATLLVSPLVELGVVDITAHLFVFYFAMLSAITPPVAVGVAVGSRIADSSFLGSAKQALRIGAAGFLIPYALVVNDSLVNWTLTGTPFAVFCVFVGVVALTAVTIGFDGRHVLGIGHRSAYLVLALAAMYAPAVGVYVGPSVALLVQLAAAILALVGLGLTNVGRLPSVVTPASARER